MEYFSIKYFFLIYTVGKQCWERPEDSNDMQYVLENLGVRYRSDAIFDYTNLQVIVWTTFLAMFDKSVLSMSHYQIIIVHEVQSINEISTCKQIIGSVCG